MKRCIECGGTELVPKNDEIPVGPKGGPEFQMSVKATACADPNCGGMYYSGQELQRAELACALRIAATQVMTGRILGYCRRVAGAKLVDTAPQFGMSPGLLKRIEATEAPLTAAFAEPVIALLRQAAIDLDEPIPAALLLKQRTTG